MKENIAAVLRTLASLSIGALPILSFADDLWWIESGSPWDRTAGPTCLSGITYIGNNEYYAVADNGPDCGLYKLTIPLNADGKSIWSAGYSVGARRSLSLAADIEGVAYDPGSGRVWVSDEATQSITEYDPETGAACRRVDIPPVLKQIVGNYGFESLTISGDGLTMWTANEEALTCDGDRSSYWSGTTVRLVKFTRKTVSDNWTLAAMYPYTTEKWTYQYDYGGAGRGGVSDLCALPDGSLLVLEREMSSSSEGSDIWAALGARLFHRIYRVTPSALAAATDIRDANEGLKRLSGWKAVSKELLFNGTNAKVALSNVEGICLGPGLGSGACELMTLTDAGDGNTNAQLIPRALFGLSVRTLNFAQPAAGQSSVVGSNYRFLYGATVQVALSGTSDKSPYAVDGTPLAVCDGWSVSGGSPSSGSGETASFTVSGDGTFSWNVISRTADSGYHVADSFEGLAAGTAASSIAGWAGDGCTVEETTYAPPTPPGFVMQQETHTKTLNATAEEATRSLPFSGQGAERIDVMICQSRPRSPLEPLRDDVQLQVAADERGRLCLWHLHEENGEWKRGWIPLSETTYANGEWVRVEIDFDYASNGDGDAFACVRINGSYQPTPHGVRSPTSPRPFGPWHRLAKNRLTGGVTPPAKVSFADTRVDDLMLSSMTVAPEHAGPTSVDGIAFSWFDNFGLPRNPQADAPFVPGYTLGDVHTAGIDPYSDRPLAATGFCLDAAGRPHLEFNGYKGDAPVGYRVLYSATPDFANATALGASDGAFKGDATTGSTTWKGTSAAPGGTGFYRVRAVR